MTDQAKRPRSLLYRILWKLGVIYLWAIGIFIVLFVLMLIVGFILLGLGMAYFGIS